MHSTKEKYNLNVLDGGYIWLVQLLQNLVFGSFFGSFCDSFFGSLQHYLLAIKPGACMTRLLLNIIEMNM